MFDGLSVKASKWKSVNLKKEFEIGIEKIKRDLVRIGEEKIRHEIAKRRLDKAFDYDVKSKITKDSIQFSIESKRLPNPINEKKIKIGDQFLQLSLVNELFETIPEEEQKRNQAIINKITKEILELLDKELPKLSEKVLSKM